MIAAQGPRGEAERLFHDSVVKSRGVSPFPLAMPDFQRGAPCGVRWAIRWRPARPFAEAVQRLPAYALAQCPLAKVDAELGDPEPAITRLRPLAGCDDPDYAAELASVLNDVGEVDESRTCAARAAARNDELADRHLGAFALAAPAPAPHDPTV